MCGASNKPSGFPVELLSPAGNREIGCAAIDAGADAVYIGAARFGAREAAGNSLEDIEALAQYAHGFGSRVYLTLNTLLFEEELAAARDLIWGACEAGVDALIVQDMAIPMMELPPIALHASTQTFNLTPERVRFLAEAGFSRIVLERGITLESIRAIRRAIPQEVELETFVHGAICVSYSGQCYLGHAVCGRGGNRGGCAQPCRAQYNLLNERGETLVRDQHLLSVGDLNLADHLEELIDAGVCSLKIEGRLKEKDYVVNNTAYYHQKLEALGFARTSAPSVVIPSFKANPEKSFSRGFTTYFWNGKQKGVRAAEARSIGERIGTVTTLHPDGSFMIHAASDVTPLHNGDGICFFNPAGKLSGTYINQVDGNRVIPNRTGEVRTGMEIYRNYDPTFQPTAIRKIEAGIHVDLWTQTVTALDSGGVCATLSFDTSAYEAANNRKLAEANIRKAFSKSGDTIFDVVRVEIDTPEETLPFIPAAALNTVRREVLEELQKMRLTTYEKPDPYVRPSNFPVFPAQSSHADYRANVANSLAEDFYRQCGRQVTEWALESSAHQTPQEMIGREVMRTGYCLRRELDACPKNGAKMHPDEKWLLENNGLLLELRFDCPNCEMAVVYRGKKSL